MDELNRTPSHHLPVYNIKAVSRLLGLLPVTLRAWERRYGLPTPRRGQQGYRLYSEYDVRTLRWLKTQLDSGLSIGRAVQYLNELRTQGKDPAATIPSTYPTNNASIDQLTEELTNHLIQLNDEKAAETLRRSFALYPVDQVLVEIIQPALIEIGEAWHNGKIAIAVEHYATQFFMQHLMSMLNAAASPIRSELIVAACAPGEQHQIGLLILVVMLRWRGWNVKYLGPDLKLDRIEEALAPLRPRMLLFSATRYESAQTMLNLPSILKNFPEPAPLIVLGGQAFQSLQLPEDIPAIYLNAQPSEMIETIENLIQASGASSR
jgi:DNA-binding transcriptional MerR regulator